MTIIQNKKNNLFTEIIKKVGIYSITKEISHNRYRCLQNYRYHQPVRELLDEASLIECNVKICHNYHAWPSPITRKTTTIHLQTAWLIQIATRRLRLKIMKNSGKAFAQQLYHVICTTMGCLLAKKIVTYSYYACHCSNSQKKTINYVVFWRRVSVFLICRFQITAVSRHQLCLAFSSTDCALPVNSVFIFFLNAKRITIEYCQLVSIVFSCITYCKYNKGELCNGNNYAV